MVASAVDEQYCMDFTNRVIMNALHTLASVLTVPLAMATQPANAGIHLMTGKNAGNTDIAHCYFWMW